MVVVAVMTITVAAAAAVTPVLVELAAIELLHRILPVVVFTQESAVIH